MTKHLPKLHAPQAPKAEIWMIIVGVCMMFRDISYDISSITESTITLQQMDASCCKMLYTILVASILNEKILISRMLIPPGSVGGVVGVTVLGGCFNSIGKGKSSLEDQQQVAVVRLTAVGCEPVRPAPFFDYETST